MAVEKLHYFPLQKTSQGKTPMKTFAVPGIDSETFDEIICVYTIKPILRKDENGKPFYKPTLVTVEKRTFHTLKQRGELIYDANGGRSLYYAKKACIEACEERINSLTKNLKES